MYPSLPLCLVSLRKALPVNLWLTFFFGGVGGRSWVESQQAPVILLSLAPSVHGTITAFMWVLVDLTIIQQMILTTKPTLLYYFLKQVLLLNLELEFQIDWLDSESQRTGCLCLPAQSWLQTCTTTLDFYTGARDLNSGHVPVQEALCPPSVFVFVFIIFIMCVVCVCVSVMCHTMLVKVGRQFEGIHSFYLGIEFRLPSLSTSTFIC